MQMNQTLQQHEIHSTLQCPTCSTSRLYQLADGRFKCSLCRKIFSASANRQSRLAPVVREGLATAFWNMDGTADTANALDLNIKTVQKYFGLLREHLAKLSRQTILQQFESDTLPAAWFQSFPQQQSCGQTANPIAAIVKSGDAINFLFAAPVTSQPKISGNSYFGLALCAG
jgi:transposase-like protein